MVFSFFKKPPQKMPERSAARPRAPLPDVKLPERPADAPVRIEPLPDLEFSLETLPPKMPVGQPLASSAGPEKGADRGPETLPGIDPEFGVDDFDDEFTESSVMAINVEHDIDPLQADVEQVVVLFANGQDAAARSLLEGFIRAYPGSEGKRLWLLLLDLLQILGERAEFDRCCVEFAERCETSPPSWREHGFKVRSTATGGVLALQGVLTGDDLRPIEQLKRLLGQSGELLLDCSKLVGCDDIVAGVLAECLIAARRAGKPLRLVGAESLQQRLDERLKPGNPEHEASWRLLLELLQRQAPQAHFEERAVDYAVTFELSPPSWESLPKSVSQPGATSPLDDACYLSGELKNQRFDDLSKYLASHEVAILDFSGVLRLDFFSAGQLVNRLVPFKAAGKDIVIRSPNHLVAELMAVVGLNKQARIIVPKS